MNIYLNETILKVFPNGEIWRFGLKAGKSKEPTWHLLKGTICIDDNGYKSHQTKINYKLYRTSRVIAYAYLRFDLDEREDTIDHIDRNSLNNHISNLRCASRREQCLNRSMNINAVGYYWHTQSQRWRAKICIDYKVKHLGNFKTKEEAHQAYLQAVNS